jgi:ribosomal protein S18 acetylase RimI-like enzyme
MRNEAIQIDPAREDDLDELARLFTAYRVFYECEPDEAAARRFLSMLISEGRSRFFIARLDGKPAGFMHLSPALSTLAMTKTWFLEDIFVDPQARKRGLGSALLDEAENFARSTGATRISLTTAHSNLTAQRVYLSAGYEHDEVFRTYSLELD